MNRVSPKPSYFSSQLMLRFILAIAVAVGVYYLFPGFSQEIRLLLSFDLGLLVHLGLLGSLLWRATPEKTYRHAQRGEPSNAALLLVVVLFSLSSLVGVALMLDNSQARLPIISNVHMGLSLVAIFLSWLLVHSYYAIHYAHIYYDEVNEGEESGEQTHPYVKGLEFPHGEMVCYRDFLYYSFTIAMCYQTSDVSIISSTMRSVSLLQSILSFIFVAIIFGLVVNVVSNVV